MPKTSAATVRRHIWGSRCFPVDPVWIANEMGLSVVETALDSSVSGALLKAPEQDPVIILNQNDSKARKRFACAHQLGRYITHTDGGCPLEYEYIDYRGYVAGGADNLESMHTGSFAADLLMPESEVARLAHAGYSPVMMALYFGVSDDAINDRLSMMHRDYLY